MGKNLVSILIPVYTREELVRRALESAINQTYENIEVIAVDNKSMDRTYAVLKEYADKYPDVKVYQNEENLGPVRNWKKCLEYATGEYVKILWSDDLIDEKFIEKTLPFLVDDPRIGFVFTGTEIFNDETQERIKSYFIGNTGKYDSKKFIEGSLLRGPYPVSPGNAIFRKKDMDNSLVIDIPNKLGIDFKMHGMGNDLLIFLLTAIKYPKFAFVNETLSFFRSHMESITLAENKLKTTIRYNAAKAYFVENYVKDIELEKKFNTILLYSYIMSLIKGRRYNIKSIKDFYLNKKYIGVSFLFIGKFIFRKMVLLLRLVEEAGGK